MKKFTLLLVAVISTLFLNAQSYMWSQCANFGGGNRYSPFGFATGGNCYVGGGVTFNGAVYNYNYQDFWKYDPITDQWTQLANFAGAGRNGSTGFAIGNYGYVCLGWTPAQVNDLWQYDVVNNTWTQKTNFGGAPRYDAAWFVISNSAYVGTGYTPWSNDFWKYDSQNDTWTQIANVGGQPRQCAAGFSIGGYGYVCGGSEEFNNYTNDLWQYDTNLNIWTLKAPFPATPRTACFVFTIGNRGFVGCGSNITTVYDDFYSYDASTDSWSQIANFPGGLRMQGVWMQDGSCGYAGMGSPSIYPNIVSQQDFWKLCDVTSIDEATSFLSDLSIKNINGKLIVNSTKNWNEKMNLKIYDLAGREILSDVMPAHSNNHSVNFNNFKGMYSFKISRMDNNLIKSGKFIF